MKPRLVRRLGIAVSIVATLVAASSASATFPGRNGRIAYTRVDGQGQQSQIWVMNADGSAQTQVTHEANGASLPSWSPVAPRLAYQSAGSIYAINADGAGRVQVATGDGAREASWSPDGTEIVFMKSRVVTDPDGVPHFFGVLHVVHADGAGDAIAANLDAIRPKYSPDGTRIGMTDDVEYSGSPDIYVLGGGGFLTNHSNDEFLDWSPDGARILGHQDFPAALYTMSPNGADRVALPAGVAGAGMSYSPDGTKFVSWRGSPGDIYTTSLDGSNSTNLTNTPGAWELQPDWQPSLGPNRADFKNSNQFCRAEQSFWGNQFADRYGGGANAFGKCVSGSH